MVTGTHTHTHSLTHPHFYTLARPRPNTNDAHQVECFTDDAAAMPDAFFAQFDVVVLSDLPPAQLVSAFCVVGGYRMRFGIASICTIDGID